MTALVTGATGFLGGALVNELLQSDGPVRILARDGRSARERFGDEVEIVCGEITDGCSVREAVSGATTIYHLAGRLYHPSVPTEIYQRTHVQGTRTVLEACRGQAQLRCFVHVSTTGVHGVTGRSIADEDAPYAPTTPYEASKLAGELLALEAWRDEALPVTVVRPGLVYGPGDLHLLGLFNSIDRGLFRVIAGGSALLHPVYVDDVVSALRLCSVQPLALGRSYNVAGARPVTVRELGAAVAGALGKEPARGSIPLWLANLAADVFSLVPGMSGERAPLTRSRVEFLTQSRAYDIARAREELGYVPRVDLEEGMNLTVDWYRRHGYLGGRITSGRTVR